MSLNRAISLGSEEFHPSSFRHTGIPSQADRRHSTASAASQKSSVMGQLNFNPAAGPSWDQSPNDYDVEESEVGGEESLSEEHSESYAASSIAWSTQSDGLGAFNVPQWKRLAQVFVAVIYCFLSAGIVFGFAALKPLLIREGAYRERCKKDEIGETACYEQDLRLNFMFTLAVVATNVCALPVGTILDMCGPRITSIIGSFLLALGSTVFALSPHLPFDGYIPGYFLIAIGGPFVFISSFQLSNAFPKHSGLILSMITGAFDASSALFLLFRIVYGSWLTIQNLFILYLIVPALILVSQIFLMPTTSYKSLGEPGRDAQEDSAPTNANRNINESWTNQDNKDPFKTSGVWGAMHMASALQQIRSPWFILMTAFTIFQMLRINYFIATIYQQYSHLLSSDTLASQLNHAFDILLPLGGVIAMPFVGLILDNTSTPAVLFSLVLVATIIGILNTIPANLPIAYIHITFFSLYRPFFYTVISDYAAKVFGFQTFGKVYGLIICLAGAGNFLETPLDILTFKLFAQNPIPVNILLTIVAFVAGSLLVLFVWWRARERMSMIDVVVETGRGVGRRASIGSGGSRRKAMRTRRRRRFSWHAGEPCETDRLLPHRRLDASDEGIMYDTIR
ncbi:hypothetical protein AJ80_09471 [Polytolypa hystricis UAMH7299]|uniref:Major facilitator superfamily (MFS) profile domain-containing protein n=1 Tax=Polytolypa hystricis (strain UAMH7299) TaxID=1447883 RepID=A0A2B7WQL2_POLH7|nr:hypothetical protein AJ80_09471 [Polytolypa hystricis UAMH7299]